MTLSTRAAPIGHNSLVGRIGWGFEIRTMPRADVMRAGNAETEYREAFQPVEKMTQWRSQCVD
jgi:hypothetical protein